MKDQAYQDMNEEGMNADIDPSRLRERERKSDNPELCPRRLLRITMLSETCQVFYNHFIWIHNYAFSYLELQMSCE